MRTFCQLLLNVAPNEETKDSFEQVVGLLFPLQTQLDRAMQGSPYNSYLRKMIRYETFIVGYDLA